MIYLTWVNPYYCEVAPAIRFPALLGQGGVEPAGISYKATFDDAFYGPNRTATSLDDTDATTVVDGGLGTLWNPPPGQHQFFPSHTSIAGPGLCSANPLSSVFTNWNNTGQPRISNVSVTATLPAGSYELRGTVTAANGLPANGVQVTETGNGTSSSVTTWTDGSYYFALPSGSYTITPSEAGLSFSPTQRVVNLNTDTVGVNFSVGAGLSVATTSLPNGALRIPYGQTLAATGGTAPYSWSLQSGALPDGLSLDASTGAITGKPTKAGTFAFTVQVADTGSPQQTATAALSITIEEVTLTPSVAVGKRTCDHACTVSEGQTTLVLAVTDKPCDGSYSFDVDPNDGSGVITNVPITGSCDTSRTPSVFTGEGSVTHVFADESSGPLTASFTLHDPDGGDLRATLPVTVGEGNNLSGTGVKISVVSGSPVSGTVATFTARSDNGYSAPAADMSATIDWGDNTAPSSGTITQSGNTYTVDGSHVYTERPGPWLVTTTLSDDAPGSAQARAHSQARLRSFTVTPNSGVDAGAKLKLDGSGFDPFGTPIELSLDDLVDPPLTKSIPATDHFGGDATAVFGHPSADPRPHAR